MARLTWHNPGTRWFETGLDRGVLYVGSNDGVPWNGLVSFEEKPSGGEPQPRYIDGIKYLNASAPEEFEATLTAFYSPPAFDVCDGSVSLSLGYNATQQPRSKFALTYRTRIGNDIDPEGAYKLHLVYNAMVAPTDRTYSTVDDDPEPETLSWDITTQPIFHEGIAPTAHFVLDSRIAPAWLMNQVERYLYGTDTTPSRLPLPATILQLVPGEYDDAFYDEDFFG